MHEPDRHRKGQESFGIKSLASSTCSSTPVSTISPLSGNLGSSTVILFVLSGEEKVRDRHRTLLPVGTSVTSSGYLLLGFVGD